MQEIYELGSERKTKTNKYGKNGNNNVNAKENERKMYHNDRKLETIKERQKVENKEWKRSRRLNEELKENEEDMNKNMWNIRIIAVDYGLDNRGVTVRVPGW
jgi:hypothetical protein